jgi:hypothetical protein
MNTVHYVDFHFINPLLGQSTDSVDCPSKVGTLFMKIRPCIECPFRALKIHELLFRERVNSYNMC